jgi:hypothetical protein
LFFRLIFAALFYKAMLKFFTLILLFLLGYYLIKSVYRLFSLFFSGDGSDNRKYQSKQGNVTIEYKEPAKKRFDKDSGEYVDYEEIKK